MLTLPVTAIRNGMPFTCGQTVISRAPDNGWIKSVIQNGEIRWVLSTERIEFASHQFLRKFITSHGLLTGRFLHNGRKYRIVKKSVLGVQGLSCAKANFQQYMEITQDETVNDCKNSTVFDSNALGQHIYVWKDCLGSVFCIVHYRAQVFDCQYCASVRGISAEKQLDKKYLIDGFWMGLTIFCSCFLQVSGLTLDTSPGKSAFLSTTYCVMVPFIYWLVTKDRPKAHHILCVFLCLTGVGILSLSGGWGMSKGDIVTVLSGLPYAMNIVISAIVCRNRNALLLTTIELWVVTIFAWIFVFVGNTFPSEFPMKAVGGIVYMGLLATALCLYLQSYGLKYAEPAIGRMLLSLESVFGVVFSVIIYHEQVTFRMLVGFAVIFIAILLSQWDGKKRLSA